jgi:hypothetical protein
MFNELHFYSSAFQLVREHKADTAAADDRNSSHFLAIIEEISRQCIKGSGGADKKHLVMRADYSCAAGYKELIVAGNSGNKDIGGEITIHDQFIDEERGFFDSILEEFCLSSGKEFHIKGSRYRNYAKNILGEKLLWPDDGIDIIACLIVAVGRGGKVMVKCRFADKTDGFRIGYFLDCPAGDDVRFIQSGTGDKKSGFAGLYFFQNGDISTTAFGNADIEVTEFLTQISIIMQQSDIMLLVQS